MSSKVLRAVGDDDGVSVFKLIQESQTLGLFLACPLRLWPSRSQERYGAMAAAVSPFAR
ncbi:hypothetical protein QF037_000075 [Streptomyces canus]|nr:hypothetical protein [Streptomyces canus]